MRISAKIAFYIVSLLPMFAGGCIKENDTPSYSLAAGDEVPVFSVLMSDGQVRNSMDLRGRIGVIVFFNTECEDCRRELPEVQKAYELCGDEACFICISREEGEAEVAAYWREHSLTLPYSAQRDRIIYNMFASSGIPRVYVSDPLMHISTVFSERDTFSAGRLVESVHAAQNASVL